MPNIQFTPESIQMWIGIATAIVKGGSEVVADFKNFLADHGIEADNAILDAQIADDDAHIQKETDIKNS